MTNRQERVLKAAKSGLAYGKSRCRGLPRLAGAVARLEDAVTAADQAAREQFAARTSRGQPRRNVGQCKSVLLKQHLRPLAVDALALLAGLPGIEASLRLERFKASAARHLESAKRIRRIAEEHAQELIEERSYEPDFLERFDAAVANLIAAARLGRGEGRARYSRATREVEAKITAVRAAVVGLNAQMLAHFDDRAVVAAWRRAKRVPAKLGRPRKRGRRG